MTSAWIAAYVATQDATERFLVLSISLYKRLPPDEALDRLREIIVDSEAIEVVDEAYAQFLAATNQTL